MLLFLRLASSVFVFRNITHQFSSRPLNDSSQLSPLIASHDRVIVLGASAADETLWTTFANAQHFYPDALLVPVLSRQLKRWVRPPLPELPPYLLVFDRQNVTAFVGPVDSDPSLINLIDLYATESRPTLAKKPYVIQALNGAPVTVVTTPSTFQAGLGLVRGSGHPINVIVAGADVAKELGIEKCGVFRLIDSDLEPFDCSVEQFELHSRPPFQVSHRRIRHLPDDLVLVRVGRTDTGVTDALVELGTSFPEFRIVFMRDEETEKLRWTIGGWFKDGYTAVAVTNLSGLSFFETAGYITGDLCKESTFNVTSWKEQLSKLLSDIRSGALERRYRSEPIEDALPGHIQKAVGLNYEEIVGNRNVDVVVAFQRSRCQKCASVVRKMRRFAEDLEAANCPDFLFFTIDHTRNQIPGGLPATASPCVLFYPAHKKEVYVLPFESRQYLIWLTGKYAANPHGIRPKLASQKKLDKAASRIAELEKIVKPELVEPLRKTFGDLRADVQATGDDGL
jgi:hypothetical protein